jgi:hypothetical protein
MPQPNLADRFHETNLPSQRYHLRLPYTVKLDHIQRKKWLQWTEISVQDVGVEIILSQTISFS